MHGEGNFSISTWDEKPCDESWGGAKVTRASVTQTVTGVIEGDARCEYVLVYQDSGTAEFIVVIRINGKVDGRAGSFVMEGRGNFANMIAVCNFNIIAGTGTNQLSTLRGGGKYEAKHSDYPNVPFTLDYHFV